MILTHTIILLYISPIGINHNSAVWGWNVIMIVFALYFLKKPLKEKINFRLTGFNFIWAIVIYVLPLLNIFELYYPYFSFDLYSVNRHYLIVKADFDDCKPLKKYTEKTQEDNYHLNLNTYNWSLKDINVPVPHSKWLYVKIITAFENKYPKLNTTFNILNYPYKSSETFTGY